MVRFRSWLLLLLVIHVLVHPVVHGLCASSTVTHSTTVALPTDSTSTVGSLEDCSLCRAGHGAMLWADLQQVERLNPLWIPIRLRAVSEASLGVQHRLPSRAPPSL